MVTVDEDGEYRYAGGDRETVDAGDMTSLTAH